MTDKNDQKSELDTKELKLEKRRKALKNILAGSGTVVTAAAMHEKWAKPVIESVVLPAHAQTSGNLVAGFVLTNFAAAPDQNQLLDTLVPSAHAAPPTTPKSICINVNGSAASAQVTVSGDSTVYTAAFTLPTAAPITLSPTANGYTITAALDTGGNSVSGVVSAQGAASYTAPKSGASCQLTVPTTQSFTTPFGPSDRNIKENFSAVDDQEVLRKVANLNIEHWNYNDREHGVRHIGPMAQDFMTAFNVGDSDRHINFIDANGVNLAAIKALNTKLEEKENQILKLQAQVASIMRKLDKLS